MLKEHTGQDEKLKFKYVKTFLIVLPLHSYAQDNRLPELRSCMTSEFAIAVGKADKTKSYEENEEIGKRLGYVIVEFYKKSIWALSNPEVDGPNVFMYAIEHASERQKYMTKEALEKDIKRCRKSFEK